jgi:hypothetical protein
MHITRSNFLSAAAFALTVVAAHAADDKQSRDVPNFNQMDKNDDGALTRSEASGNPKLLVHFAQVDDNGDGRLTRAEYLEIMARQDLYNVRDSLAEFINPEGKPPLAVAQPAQRAQGESSGSGQSQQPAQSEDEKQLPLAASSQLVRTVQQSLERQGIEPGPVDGIWGPRTHQALRDFQDQQGLQSTGQLDARTLNALGVSEAQTASAGGSASSGGSSGQKHSLPTFQRADKDGDGYVSRGELSAATGSEQNAHR